MTIVEEDNTELCEECYQGMYWTGWEWLHVISAVRECWPNSNDPRERGITATRRPPDCTDAVVSR